MTKPIYKDYIVSTEWRGKHKGFLSQSRYRCSFFPWVRVGRGHPYNCHHMNYIHLGEEKLWRDVVVLCPFAHNTIIHGILSGFKRPSQQRSYPNAAQRLAHLWCCTPVLVRVAFLALVLFNIVRFVR